MALQETAGRKLEATEHSVSTDRSSCIFRTGWIEAAGRTQEWRDPIAVPSEQSQAALAHTSFHGSAAAVGVGVSPAKLLSGQQMAAQSNPALGKPQGLVPEAIDLARGA
jgi:hypothetical protein